MLDSSEDDVPMLTPAQRSQMQSLHDILTAVAPTRVPSPSFESSLDTSFADDSWADDGEKENAPPVSQATIVTPARRPPKASSMSQDVLEKAKQRISKVPKKRSMDEVLVDLQT
jgi:hypothetical protein